jgi:hypothetical protein
MAGFRNVLVHGYDDVDLAVVRDASSAAWSISNGSSPPFVAASERSRQARSDSLVTTRTGTSRSAANPMRS